MAPHVEIINEETRKRIKKMLKETTSDSVNVDITDPWYTAEDLWPSKPDQIICITKEQTLGEIRAFVKAGEVRIVKQTRK